MTFKAKTIHSAIVTAIGAPLDKNKWCFNGWTIKLSNRGISISPHDEAKEKLGISFPAKKRYIPLTNLDGTSLGSLLNAVKTRKTKRCISKELKEIKAKEKSKSKHIALEKRLWCEGCNLCPEGMKATACSKLRFSESDSVYYCTDPDFWTNHYCPKAKHVDDHNPMFGFFVCTVTGKRCIHQREIAVKGISILDKSYKECDLLRIA